MAARADLAACAMSCHPTTESMDNPPAFALSELALSMLYRLSAYAVIHLIDDAALLSILFI